MGKFGLTLLSFAAFIRLSTSFLTPEVLLVLPKAHLAPNARCSSDLRAGGAVKDTETTVDASTESSLVFRGDYVRVSDSAPSISSARIVEFFQDEKNRNCLITGGDRLDSHSVPVTDELLERWKDRALALGAVEPNSSDIIISVRTGGIQFPGVKIDTIALIGSKLLLPNKPTDCPVYEFVLIQDTREVSGAKPIVWIFNRLMAAVTKKDTTPLSLSRIFVVPSEDGSTLSFKIESFLEINVSFPKILLRIIPSAKEKTEEQGSEAVRKALQKDIDVAFAKFYDNYAAFAK